MPKKSDRFSRGCSRWDGFYSGSKYSETASKETETGQHTPEHEPQSEHDDWILRADLPGEVRASHAERFFFAFWDFAVAGGFLTAFAA